MTDDDDGPRSLAELLEGFDPTETGPLDLAAMASDRVRTFVDENSRVLVLATALVVVASWHYDVPLRVPTIPTWALVMLATAVAASPVAWWAGVRLVRWLYDPDHVYISEVNAASGDQRLLRISPDRFDELTVYNHNEERRERDFLHEVRINGKRAYEVDSYDREQNVAIASWQAGVTNVEIRQDRSRIKSIKTVLEREADKALELIVNHSDHVRAVAREVSMDLIRVAEEGELPDSDALHERLSERLDEANPGEQLLETVDESANGEGDESTEISLEVDGDADHQTVFERAKELELADGTFEEGGDD